MRDYDKEPIIIEITLEKFLFIGLYFFWFGLLFYKIFTADKSLNEIILQKGFLLFIGSFIYLSCGLYRVVRTKAFYKFKNDKISYSAYKKDFEFSPDKITSAHNLIFIWNTYGLNEYRNKTKFQLFLKTDILELLFYILQILITISFDILFIYPYRILTSRVCKNLVFYLNDGNFMSVAVNSQEEYDEILKYLATKNIHINDKTKFLQVAYKETKIYFTQRSKNEY